MAQPITYQCVRCLLRYTANGSKICTQCLKSPPKILVSRGIDTMYKQPRNYTWKEPRAEELVIDEAELKRLQEVKTRKGKYKHQSTVRIKRETTRSYKGRVFKKSVKE